MTKRIKKPVAAERQADIELLPAVLAVAKDEYPDLDTAEISAKVFELAADLVAQVDLAAPLPSKVQALNQYLFEQRGFAGNHDEFYDPRNSYLNDVIERKLGIPISLAVLQIECARALGVTLEGVSFPGHFLVRVPMEDGLLVLDPYHSGRSLGADELRQRARPHFGDRDIDDQQLLGMLAPASNRAIVARMLRNLKGVYAEQANWEKALRSAHRLLEVDDSQPSDWRDRGLFYLKIGLGKPALHDLQRYLELEPKAGDTNEVRDAMIEAASIRDRMH